MSRPYRICTRCVMDTSDPEIVFDRSGICNHCTECLERMRRQLLPPQEREVALQKLVAKIKREGKGKEYDCIIGVSGGVDSSMTAYLVKKLGLRPLAVHFDNGWDSEIGADNIKRVLRALAIELYTYVVDWEEFRDLQLSFLKASVINAEAPTDHGMTATLWRTANRLDIRFVLSGSNVVTEAIMPTSWGHYNQDLRLLKEIHRRFGTMPLRTMPTISVLDYLRFVFVRRIRQVPILNYVEYDKAKAKELLIEELGWRDYGGKHYESVFTRFFQGYYLPTKFGIDKRRAHLSTLICAGQVSREQTLAELELPCYPPDLLEQDMRYVTKKLGLTLEQFQAIVDTPAARARDFPSNYLLFHTLGRYKDAFRAIATGA